MFRKLFPVFLAMACMGIILLCASPAAHSKYEETQRSAKKYKQKKSGESAMETVIRREAQIGAATEVRRAKTTFYMVFTNGCLLTILGIVGIIIARVQRARDVGGVLGSGDPYG